MRYIVRYWTLPVSYSTIWDTNSNETVIPQRCTLTINNSCIIVRFHTVRCVGNSWLHERLGWTPWEMPGTNKHVQSRRQTMLTTALDCDSGIHLKLITIKYCCNE
uniref:Uncharacterized protein n=1 Tax=Glossina pallidipes TaxID=7398 RepID=A0A1A9ZR20_GLOPL